MAVLIDLSPRPPGLARPAFAAFLAGFVLVGASPNAVAADGFGGVGYVELPFQQLVVIRMGADPEPDAIISLSDSKCAGAKTDTG
ncbi:hypothetical protein [Fulvimarina sp. MAC8]|uniref:hypothetical protein n=1 Tax=Fulvimarina sp. MAC8 TaxID=3162874 RepID=UPI0032EE554B